MIQLGTFKPDGRWKCALCPQYGGEPGEWLCSITDSKGKALSFICDKHQQWTLAEILSRLEDRQKQSGRVIFKEGDREVELSNPAEYEDTKIAKPNEGVWYQFDGKTGKFLPPDGGSLSDGWRIVE
jgi:hypothetical protein